MAIITTHLKTNLSALRTGQFCINKNRSFQIQNLVNFKIVNSPQSLILYFVPVTQKTFLIPYITNKFVHNIFS